MIPVLLAQATPLAGAAAFLLLVVCLVVFILFAALALPKPTLPDVGIGDRVRGMIINLTPLPAEANIDMTVEGSVLAVTPMEVRIVADDGTVFRCYRTGVVVLQRDHEPNTKPFKYGDHVHSLSLDPGPYDEVAGFIVRIEGDTLSVRMDSGVVVRCRVRDTHFVNETK